MRTLTTVAALVALAVAGCTAQTAEVAPAEVVCHEDEECWDWRTMGGHDAGATVTLFDGEEMSGVITDNGDGTYTFVPKS